MKAIRKVTWLIVKLLYAFLRWLPVKKRSVFVSYFSENPQGNLRCALDWMRAHSDAPIVTLFTVYKGGLRAKLSYVRHTVREVYYYSTSALVVLEGNSFVLSCIRKKPAVHTVQLWHAAGAFKRFGEDTERLYPIRGLDAAVVSTPEVADIYAHALNVPGSEVYAVGIMRADIWTKEGAVLRAREQIDAAHPELKGKKIALYAPTFRGAGIEDVSMQQVDYAGMMRALSGWQLAVRLHPMMREKVPSEVVDLGEEDLMTVLAAADLLITDYSSIIFEYSLLGRPMLFYTPDRVAYGKERGFYFGYEQFVPGKVCDSLEQLAQAVKDEDFEQQRLERFRRRFTYGFDGKATERTGTLLLQWLNENPKS